MKIIYIGSLSVADSDFPLIKKLQSKLDIISYFELSSLNKKSGLFNIKEIIPINGVVPARRYKEFLEYDGFIDIDKIFIINSIHHRVRDPRAWLLWIKVLIHMYRQKADVLHSVWPFAYLKQLLYLLPINKVFTVHDPFPHSGQKTKYSEFCRRKAFKKADALVLLNQQQMTDFCHHYDVDVRKVFYNKMGDFSCYRYIKPLSIQEDKDYILFFGQIQEHKGIEYLAEAMLKVHEKHPEVNLIIAGKGKFYFDFTPYENKDYIKLRNYYITVPELVGLLNNCLFSVVPYKDATQSGVVLTAYSLNVPLVATSVGALSETIHDGKTGVLVPPCDSGKLADAINSLLDNRELITFMKRNIKNQWRDEMDWTPIANKYIECYKGCIC